MSGRFLLVGWDAADWALLRPLLDAGAMPTLAALVEEGTSGALDSAPPAVGAMQWTSLATGRSAGAHGVLHDAEIEAGRPAPVSADGRACPAVWEILAPDGLRSLAVGWPATRRSPAGGARVVSDCPSEWVPDLADLRVRPEELDAEVLEFFVPAWRKLVPAGDARVASLRLALAADYSAHAATTYFLEQEVWDFCAVRYAALARLGAFRRIHAPEGEWVSPHDREIFGEVIRGVCRTLDLMLARLIDLAGPGANLVLVSPGGPAAAARECALDEPPQAPGIFVARGPAFREDELVHGAGALDVAPTVLAAFGLSCPEMEGAALGRVLVEPAAARRTASAPGRALVVDEAGAPGFERAWNLARSLRAAGRDAEALPVLRRLFARFPERADVAAALFECEVRAGDADAAATTMEVLCEALPPAPVRRLFEARLLLARGDAEGARAVAAEVMESRPRSVPALVRLGGIFLDLGDWERLREVATHALGTGHSSPLAWLVLAAAHVRKRESAQAALAAREAIRLRYALPEAHYLLGRALLMEGMPAAAREAFEAACALDPDHAGARAGLRRIGRMLGAAERMG